MKKIFLGLVVFIFLTSLKCNNDNPPPKTQQLPPISTTGSNTFGCMVNGAIWTPFSSFQHPNINSAHGDDPYTKNKTYLISAFNDRDGEKSSIGIGIQNLKDTGTYTIHNTAPFFTTPSINLTYGKSGSYFYPVVSTWYVHISRLDTVAKIISGTFEFSEKTDSMTNPNTGVEISNGRFDVHYPGTF